MVVDLEDFYPEGQRVAYLILKDWLYEGFVLREKEFRKKVKDYDWSTHTKITMWLLPVLLMLLFQLGLICLLTIELQALC